MLRPSYEFTETGIRGLKVVDKHSKVEKHQKFLAEMGVTLKGVLKPTERVFLEYLYDLYNNPDSSLMLDIEMCIPIFLDKRHEHRQHCRGFVESPHIHGLNLDIDVIYTYFDISMISWSGHSTSMRQAISDYLAKGKSPESIHFYHDYIIDPVGSQVGHYTWHHDDEEFHIRFFYEGNLVFYYYNSMIMVWADGGTMPSKLNALSADFNTFQGLGELIVPSPHETEMARPIQFWISQNTSGILIDVKTDDARTQIQRIINHCLPAVVENPKTGGSKPFHKPAPKIPAKPTQRAGADFGETRPRILDLD